MRRGIWLVAAALLPSSVLSAQTHLNDFFEVKVRPILVKNCFACHTQSKMGGLEITSRDALLKGGASGPAIVPGQPASSLLIQAVRRTHDRLKMPPTAPLAEADIETLTTWVQNGAAWPQSASKPQSPHGKFLVTAEQKDFWAFRPLAKLAAPAVSDQHWARSAIDRFVLAELESKRLSPVAFASKRDLIRRAYFDVIGIPPTPDEVRAFEADRSPDAFAKVVDRLLASPHYGERWGRHWLDLARYSDDAPRKRESATRRKEEASQAYRYRDWVVKAFNEDMPYGRFVKAQIAADLLPENERKDAMGGLGFYALTPLEPDDRIDVTGSAFLAMTIGCARCHDHKFDPMSTEDFYAMLGIFNSSKADEYPLDSQAAVNQYKALRKAADDEQAALDTFLETQRTQLIDALAAQSAAYLKAGHQVLGPAKRQSKEVADEAALDAEVLERWVEYVRGRTWEHTYLDAYVKLLADEAPADLDRVTREVQSSLVAILREKKDIDKENDLRLGGIAPDTPGNKIGLIALDRNKFYLWKDIAAHDNFKSGTNNYTAGLLYFGGSKIERFLDGIWKRHVESMKETVKAAQSRVPPKYAYLHVIADSEKPKNEHVRIRGGEDNLGPEVPRRFLTVLAKGDPEPFVSGSGRKELADAIADPANPLPWRVMANRIWLHHFGRGLVDTPSNFGQMGERPSNPALLDYLALRLVENDGSIKSLHREIMLSSTYMLSASGAEKNREVDPDNRLNWRANRRRLDVEVIRDSMLAVAGSLDPALSGPAQPIDKMHRRRTIYGEVTRKKTDTALGLFDFPNPVASSPKRIETATPLQGLYLLNSEEVMTRAAELAERVAMDAGDANEPRIERLYRLLYGRSPSAAELAAGIEFLAGGSGGWKIYAQALLSSNEFLFTP